jgi:hypothetical protein
MAERQRAAYMEFYEPIYVEMAGYEMEDEVKERIRQMFPFLADDSGPAAPWLLPQFGEQGAKGLVVFIHVDESDKLLPESSRELRSAKR